MPLSGLAASPGPPERVDLVSVNSRKLRWRSLHGLPRQPNPLCGMAPRFKIGGPKRLPARQNSNYGYHNHVSVCVNLRVDDSLRNRVISSNERAGCTVLTSQPGQYSVTHAAIIAYRQEAVFGHCVVGGHQPPPRLTARTAAMPSRSQAAAPRSNIPTLAGTRDKGPSATAPLFPYTPCWPAFQVGTASMGPLIPKNRPIWQSPLVLPRFDHLQVR